MFIFIEYFLPHSVPVKLNKASAESSPSGFGSAQLALLFIIIYYCQAQKSSVRIKVTAYHLLAAVNMSEKKLFVN